MWWIVLSLVAAVPVEISVRVSGGADACTFAERVPRAVARMLPGLRVSLDAAPVRTVPPRGLSVLVTPRAGRVTVDLLEADLRSPTVRALPSPPDACAATADGIALVVERHLRDLGWEPPPTPPPELARADAEPGSLRAGDARTAPSTTTGTTTATGGAGTATGGAGTATGGAGTATGGAETATGGTATGGAVTATGGTATGTTSPSLARVGGAAGSLSLSLGLRGLGLLGLAPGRSDGGATSRIAGGGALFVRGARGPLELVAEAGVLALGGEDILRGSRLVGAISAWSFAAGLKAGACLDAGEAAAACLDVGGGLERFSGSTSGDGVYRGRVATALAPLLSAGLRAEWGVAPGLHLFAGADVLGRPVRTVFSIEGATTTYRVPLVELSATVGGRVTIF